MKKSILYIRTLLCTLCLNACGDQFLDKNPQGQFSPVSMQSPEGVERLLVGAYALLDGVGTSGVTDWHAGASNWIYGGVVSDDAYKGSDAGDQPEITFLERYVWLPTNLHLYGKWRTVYDGVSRANDVLRTLAGVEGIDEARREQIQAEARFLRGHYHFEAKKMWGNIPYVDEAAWDPTNPSSVLVPNTEDAWPKIEADFQFALERLPAEQDEKGRPTRFAAMAYLAKCHMFQAFPGGQPDQEMLARAKALLEQILAEGDYSLVDRFHDNFAVETRNNQESIFEIQYSLTTSDGSGGNVGDVLNYMYPNGPGGCCGFYQPSQNLVNAYKTEGGLPLLDTFNEVDVKNDEGLFSDQPFTPHAGPLDPRLDWTVARRGIPFLDWGVHPGRFWLRDQAYAGPYFGKKHFPTRAESEYIPGNFRLNANNYRLIRLGHVLLWLAECEVEIGSLEKAREYVNLIRARAANPDGFVKHGNGSNAANYQISTYQTPWTDKEFARKAVRFETRLEFGMEGHRFFDLVRWGVAEDVLNTYLAKESGLRSYLSGAKFLPHHRYYPIPEQAIVYSTQDGKPTLVQNEGY